MVAAGLLQAALYVAGLTESTLLTRSGVPPIHRYPTLINHSSHWRGFASQHWRNTQGLVILLCVTQLRDPGGLYSSCLMIHPVITGLRRLLYTMCETVMEFVGSVTSFCFQVHDNLISNMGRSGVPVRRVWVLLSPTRPVSWWILNPDCCLEVDFLNCARLGHSTHSFSGVGQAVSLVYNENEGGGGNALVRNTVPVACVLDPVCVACVWTLWLVF